MAAKDTKLYFEMELSPGTPSQDNCVTAGEFVKTTESEVSHVMSVQGYDLDSFEVKELILKLQASSIDTSKADTSKEAVEKLKSHVEKELAGSLPEGWSLKVSVDRDSGFGEGSASDDGQEETGVREAGLPGTLPELEVANIEGAQFGSHKNARALAHDPVDHPLLGVCSIQFYYHY